MQLHRITVARAADSSSTYQFARVLVLSQDRDRALLAVARQAAGLVGGDPSQTFVIHDGEVDPDAVVAVEQGRGLLPPFSDTTPTVAQLLAPPKLGAYIVVFRDKHNTTRQLKCEAVDCDAAMARCEAENPGARVTCVFTMDDVSGLYATSTATPTKRWTVVASVSVEAADSEQALGLVNDHLHKGSFEDFTIDNVEGEAPTATKTPSLTEDQRMYILQAAEYLDEHAKECRDDGADSGAVGREASAFVLRQLLAGSKA